MTKVHLPVRVEKEVLDGIKKAAEQENKTVSRYVNDTLKNHLKALSEKYLGEVSGGTEEEGARGER